MRSNGDGSVLRSDCAFQFGRERKKERGQHGMHSGVDAHRGPGTKKRHKNRERRPTKAEREDVLKVTRSRDSDGQVNASWHS